MQEVQKTRDVFALVTERIIEQLEKGTVPWEKPWTDAGVPRNLVSGKSYRGINIWLLSSLGYEQNVFLTYNQVKDLGGSVRKDEKGNLVVFWKWIDPEVNDKVNSDTTQKKIPLLKYYMVFNHAQCSGIPARFTPLPVTKQQNYPIAACEKLIQNMPHLPEIRHSGDKAYYQPFFDYVNMPVMELFINSETYYATLFHELIHSTGHKTRLDRKEMQSMEPNNFDAYSIEELTAEMGACYLNSYTGIDGWDFENHVAYIDGWLKKLRSDKRFIVYASTQAQKAADYILNLNQSFSEEGLAERIFLKACGV